jgi:phage-related protein
VASESSPPQEAVIAWEGDSLDVISGFPVGVKQNLGHQLRLLQRGEQPTDYRPVTSIGSGVFELRDADERAWYRVIYLSRIHDVIYVLHCFEKKSRTLPKNDAQVAQQRLKQVKARLAEEKKHGKRN